MSRWIRTSLAAAFAVALIAAVGCGKSSSTSGLTEGEAFDIGNLNYNVLFTRFLNPAQVEDSAYVTGQPPPPNGQKYLATFLLVKNKGSAGVALPTTAQIRAIDTTGATYAPLQSKSLFSFPYGSTLGPGDVVPTPNSVAADGPTQGSMVLFLVSEDVSNNRPLVLHITTPGKPEASIQLDI